MSGTLFFDVETVPVDYRRKERTDWMAEKVARWGQLEPDTPDFEKEIAVRMGTTPELIKIVGLGIGVGDDETKSAYVGDTLPNGDTITEKFLLETWWNAIVQEGRMYICSFNGAWFDLPVIYHRSAVLGVKPTKSLYDMKPWEDFHVDVFRRRWPGAAKYQMGLKDLGRELRLPLPQALLDLLWLDDADGGAVEGKYLEAVKTGDFSDLHQYSQLDIYLTRELARLWGGYFFPSIIKTWAELGFPYDYEQGRWLEETPEGY